MDMTYKCAWKEDDTAFYIDAYDFKFAAKNGNLAWRINNPGLIKHHSPYAKKNGSIGTWKRYAIFSNSLQGHQALKEWLHSKTLLQSDLYGIAKHYQPDSPNQFAEALSFSCKIPPKTKLHTLSQVEFDVLISSIVEFCGFGKIGNEEFYLLPKIAAKIECPEGDIYLIGVDNALTQDQAEELILSHRLDAVIVQHPNGTSHLRSRPKYHMGTFKLTWKYCEALGDFDILTLPKEFDVLARTVGKKKQEQCVWGYINGVRNTKDEALESCNLISKKAENELVLCQNLIFG